MKFNQNSGKFEKVKVIICKPYLRGEGKKVINIRTKLYKEFSINHEDKLIEKIALKSFLKRILSKKTSMKL